MTEADKLNTSRRHFVLLATTAGGGAGAAFTAVPFLASWKPSARAQALGAPVEVDISKVEPGAMIKVEWRGQAIYVVHRTKEMLATLAGLNDRLRDPASEQSEQPEYAKNEARSIKPEIAVLVGVCTHLGCAPLDRFATLEADPVLGNNWPGGFFCPCHGSKFDIAGRVFKDVPAPLNLRVPPYRFINDGRVQIGADSGAA
jgi:ubiquinol-cytochrome c reductase iron-sulfur subunit